MAQGKQEPKFQRNPRIGFRDNCDADGRQTKVPHHDLCWQSQAELKMTAGEPFLALLCATAQQSYCRHVGVCRLSVHPSVRRPPVKLIFSEPVKQINAKFGGRVHFTISPDFLLLFFKISHFLFFYYFFIWEKKLQTTSPLKVHDRFAPKNSCILLGRVSTKVV